MTTLPDLMFDLETLGTGNDPVILSIGAVHFDITTGTLGETFYRNITQASCFARGLSVDASTIEWWMHEDRAEARRALHDPEQVTLFAALHDFTAFAAGARSAWSHMGSDEGWLASAYRAIATPHPWGKYIPMDIRTASKLAGLSPKSKDMPNREGTYHNALDDAITQARYVMGIPNA